MLKKVYVEITNACNLNCDFCIKNERQVKFLTLNEFEIILDKLTNVTKYLYFHILGEPLLHPNINEFINMANTKGFYVNITTNGYLMNNLKEKNIRQLNISLHSYNEKYNVSLNDYLSAIFAKIDKLSNTYISLRLWVKNKYTQDILKYINNKYKKNINKLDLNKSIKLTNNVYLNSFHEYIWPDLNNNYYNEKGSCYALKDHIGILVNGTIVPCCLDSKGIINLGNIYHDEVNVVLNSPRAVKMREGFKNKIKCETLCKHCLFLDK